MLLRYRDRGRWTLWVSLLKDYTDYSEELLDEISEEESFILNQITKNGKISIDLEATATPWVDNSFKGTMYLPPNHDYDPCTKDGRPKAPDVFLPTTQESLDNYKRENKNLLKAQVEFLSRKLGDKE